MAMLAEPRRKQKWSVDPRNTAWSNDDSKFGQKMLEKMGWSKGKGLGAQEQGATEHIKVQVKNNQLGLGASASHEDDWLAPQEEFNQLLAELNSCHGQEGKDFLGDKEKKSFSLEEKSKSSKRRVHYTKFTKGKDLSSRSKTDLDCIFGKRQKSNISKEEHSPSAESEENNTPTVTSNLTVQEYFAKRMLELKNKSAAVPTDSDHTKPFEEKRTKHKKKKRKETEDWNKPKAKHPKKESLERQEEGWYASSKSKKMTLAESQVKDPGYELGLHSASPKRPICDEQELSTGSPAMEPKKKKKKRQEETIMGSAEDQSPERRKKKKKKKKSLE